MGEERPKEMLQTAQTPSVLGFKLYAGQLGVPLRDVWPLRLFLSHDLHRAAVAMPTSPDIYESKLIIT